MANKADDRKCKSCGEMFTPTKSQLFGWGDGKLCEHCHCLLCGYEKGDPTRVQVGRDNTFVHVRCTS